MLLGGRRVPLGTQGQQSSPKCPHVPKSILKPLLRPGLWRGPCVAQAKTLQKEGPGSTKMPTSQLVVVRVNCNEGSRELCVEPRLKSLDKASSLPYLQDSQMFFTETGQQAWMEAMEVNSISERLPDVLVEMGKCQGILA